MHGQWKRLLALILRDAAIVAATIALWLLVLRTPAGGAGPVTLAIVTAVATTIAGYLVHEWGHLLGAWVSRSAFELPAGIARSFFLFRFDRDRNTPRQFCAMSLGGFISSIAAVALLVLVLPPGLLATRLALGLVALGVLATLVLEVPEFWRVWRGGPLPRGAAYVSNDARAP